MVDAMTRTLLHLTEALVAAVVIAAAVTGGLIGAGALMSLGGLWQLAAGGALAAMPVVVGATLWALRELTD